ncbi:MAG: hypothetical protein MUP09_11465 [Thiovulaceae bacterium]|nr:hypothetical protein [Sulfurimonadaceae bacterium]
MNLPAITIPVQIPDAFPLLLHPVAVHFAVVLPLIILILELTNLITKRKALSISVYILFVLLVAVFVAAYATGLTDSKEAAPLLSEEALGALKAHKLLGTYLVYLALLPLLLKVLSLFVKKGWSRALYSLGLVTLIALTFFQAKKGGDLVFSYGANVSSQQLLQERVEALEEQIEVLKRDSNQTETNASVSKLETFDTNRSKKAVVDANMTAAAAVKVDVNSSHNRKSSDVNISK